MNINGLKLNYLLSKNNLSQTDISKMLGLSHSAINLWIKKNQIPNKHIEFMTELIGDEFKECFIDPENNIKEHSPIYGKLEKKGTPFYDIDVFAGNTGDFESIMREEPAEYYSIPHMSSDMIVRVNGDSMDGIIKSGDKIAITKITDRSFYNYGAIYVVVTKEQRLLKYLKAHEMEKNFLLLSHNKFYDPIVIPKKSVLELWIVDEVLSKRRN